MKTHVVIDTIYHEDEGNEVFVGTHQECLDFVSEQGGMSFTYQVLPLLQNELALYNH